MFGLSILTALPGLARAFWRAFIVPLLDPAVWPGLALAVTVAFCWGWFKGDAHGDRQCEARIARDKAEQDRKIRVAGEETIRATDRWLTESATLDELERKLADEASKDTDATQSCGGLDLMRRHNRIKGRSAG